ncbi:MAG: hypothetical protein KKB37_01905 [Alphaproteobacteria bacterium]|nr:hypothetical protein [Alphaproteobacteria bacterium]
MSYYEEDYIVDEIEETRDRMERNIDRLGQKFSFDNLFDKAGDVFSGVSSSRMMSGDLNVSGSKTLPAALMSAGALWLISNMSRGSGGSGGSDGNERRRIRRTPWPRDRYGNEEGEYRSNYLYGGRDPSVRDPRLRLRNTDDDRDDYERYERDRSERYAGASDYTDYSAHEEEHDDEGDGRYEHLRSRASDTMRGAGRNVRRASRGVGRYGRKYGRRARRSASETWHEVQDRYHEHPLVAGLLLAAAGAAIGMMLPPTRREDEAMGGYRDNVRDAALHEASEQYETVRHAARETAGDHGREESRPGAAESPTMTTARSATSSSSGDDTRENRPATSSNPDGGASKDENTVPSSYTTTIPTPTIDKSKND